MKNEKKPRNFWSSAEIRCMLDLIKGRVENKKHILKNFSEKFPILSFQIYKQKQVLRRLHITSLSKSKMKWVAGALGRRMPSKYVESGSR